MKPIVDLLDSTLRDGAQAEGISFSVEDKLNIVRKLDELGLSFIEAGNPGSNPKDLEFVRRAAQLPLKRAQLAAFGSTIIPYGIAAKAMADQMVTDGRQDNILAASNILQSWWSVALAVGVIVAALIGAAIGKRIVKKHLAA